MSLRESSSDGRVALCFFGRPTGITDRRGGGAAETGHRATETRSDSRSIAHLNFLPENVYVTLP